MGLEINEATRGSKRRLSDADENERITLRQTVLNMSICKLQRDQGRKEPSLLRCVVITNTVRMIEKEMDEEMQLDFEDDCFPPLSGSVAEYPSPFPTNFSNKSGTELKVDPLASVGSVYEQSLISQYKDVQNQIQSFVTSSLEESVVTSPKSNKFGAIGDHRKLKESNSKKDDDLLVMPVPSVGWDEFPCVLGSAPFEFSSAESKRPGLNIALYDFDAFSAAPALPLSLSNDEWRLFPTSCASEYERKRPDSFFEDLDQIMQVLVGM